MPTAIAIATGVTTVQGGAFAPGQGSLGQGLLGMWDMTPGGQIIPNQAAGQSALTLQLGSTTGADTNDPQPYLEDSGRRNLFINTEPLLAQIGGKSAGITQASFTEGGLTNGAQFPAAAQGDNTYLTNFSCVNSTTYTLSVYVVMNDGSAPVMGNYTVATTDFSLNLGGVIQITGYTVTLISGTLYRVSVTATNASWTTPVNNGVWRTTSESGKGFRVTGYQLEASSTPTAYQPVGATYPTKTAVMGFVTDDYILSPTIPQLSMAGDWTVYLCGKFDGSLTTRYPLSIGNTVNATDQQSIRCSASGSIVAVSQNGATVTASAAVTVPTASYVVAKLQCTAGGLVLTRLDNGSSQSTTNQLPVVAARLALGVSGTTPVAAIVDSLKLALPVLLYSRATTSAEDSRIYRWYKDQGTQKGLPLL